MIPGKPRLGIRRAIRLVMFNKIKARFNKWYLRTFGIGFVFK